MFYLAVVWIVSIIVASATGWLGYAGFRGAHVYWMNGKSGPAALLLAFGLVASLIALGVLVGAFETCYMDA